MGKAFYITVLILFSNDDGLNKHYYYVQHKEPYETYGECSYYVNTKEMRMYINRSLNEWLCDRFISIAAYGCMTRETYLEYSNPSSSSED